MKNFYNLTIKHATIYVHAYETVSDRDQALRSVPSFQKATYGLITHKLLTHKDYKRVIINHSHSPINRSLIDLADLIENRRCKNHLHPI